MRRAFQSAVGLILLAALAACGSDDFTGPGDRVANTNFSASEDFAFTIAVTTQSAMVLRGINGNVVVIGDAAATSVTVAGTRMVKSESVADAQDYLSRLEVNVTSTSTVVSAQTIQPADNGGRNLIVDYQITVPASLRVDVTNTNGNVNVAEITNDVAVANLNGNVELDDVTGNATVTLTNGNIELDNMAGSATVTTTNGNVVADAILPPGGTLSLRTTNGNAQLAIPRNTSADLSASLVNGQIRVANLVIDNLVQTPTTLSGRLGAGDGRITLQTTNGDVDIAGL